MANFPVNYTSAEPSGRIGAVKGNLNFDTGGREIGQAIENFGGMLEKVQLAQDSMKLSELDRQRDELAATFSEKLKTVTDKESHDTMIADYEKQSGSLANGANSRVKSVYQKNFNSNVVRQRTQLQGDALQIRAKDAESQFKFNSGKFLESNDMPNYYKLQNTALATGIIQKPEFGYRMKYAELDSSIAQANKQVYSGNPEAGLAMLSFDPANIDGDHLKIIAQLKINANKALAENSDVFENSLNNAMIAADQTDMNSLQLRAKADEFRASVVSDTSIDGITKTKLLKNIKTWEKDEGSVNYPVINSLNQRIDQYIQSGVVDQTLKRDITSAKLDGSFGSRKGIVSRDASAMMKRLDSAEYKTNYTATAGIRNKFENDIKREPNKDELMYLFDKDIREELSTKPMNDAQAFEYASKRAQFYKDLSKTKTKQLIGIRTTGQDVISWTDLPNSEKERDLFTLNGMDTNWWTKGETEIKAGWSKSDVKKAKEIWKGNTSVTPDMIKRFGDYLTEKNKAHFVAGKRLPVVITDDEYNVLPSGQRFTDSEGKEWIKP